MSINKAQALLLADDFLDTLGEDNLKPRETYSEMILLAGELLQACQDNLIRAGNISTGELSGSLEIQDPEMQGDILKVNLLMYYYGLFVNDGVKGIKGGNGLYQFKNQFPSREMVANLQRSINKAGNKTRNTRKYSAISKNEVKTRTTEKSKAWGAAINIKRYGIKPSGFLTNAVNVTGAKIQDRLGAALVVDIIKLIPDRL